MELGIDHNRDRLQENNIVSEVKDSFLEYSMSVIVARAIPDLRDGLKPVHRRILYSMYETGLTPEKQHRKSAKVVGDVMGNYHPHGDSSIYDAMVRLAQDFSYRYPLVDGHGNFGNIEGSSAAASRYTEVRMGKLSLEMVRDLNKNTVNMDPNYDETTFEPSVLPSRYPNILVNGTMGIAVGMATNIPPHNLKEVINGCVAYIDNPEIDTMGLMQYIKGPDFPNGAIILGNSGIKQAYETGRGSITVRSKAEIVEEKGKTMIVITQIPFGITTSELKEKVADLVHNKIINGIADYHTDLKEGIKDGVKITITLKHDANPQVVLNQLYKHTPFQSNYGIIFLMLDNGVPKTLGLKDIISKYIDYQKEIIIRRTKFDLDKAERRVHILEGLKVALDNIDAVIKIIKAAKTDEDAKKELEQKFGLDNIQSEAILEMKLRRLTGLERDKIEEELVELNKLIQELRSILASEEKVLAIIKDELQEIGNKYGDDRRTEIDMTAIEYIEDESLIPEENIMIMMTKNGYIKRTSSDSFKSQNRGGVGIKGMTTIDEDIVDRVIPLSTHDYITFFTNKGKIYRIKGYEIPEYSRTAKGVPIINLLQLEKGEVVNSVVSYSKDDNYKYLFFATKKGIVKKTAIEEFENIRKSGKICINLKDDDELIGVQKTTGEDIILLGSSSGRMVKFNENEIRVMGRTASGVRGINLDGADCICLEDVKEEDVILLVTENGYGKQTLVSEYRQTKRGSKGVKALNITDKNGNLVSVKLAKPNTDLLIMTTTGMTMRMPLDQISTLGRVTQGVKIIKLKEEQKVAAITVVDKEESESIEEEK